MVCGALPTLTATVLLLVAYASSLNGLFNREMIITEVLQAVIGTLVFVPGDLIKAGVAALAARAVQAGYPLLPVRS